MKIRSFYYAVLCALMVTAGFASCSDDDDDNPAKQPEVPAVEKTDWRDSTLVKMADTRAFILNEGSIGLNNSNMIYFDWKKDSISDKCIYEQQNAKVLGDTGNDICVFGDVMIATVNGSNYISLMNKYGVELERVSFEETAWGKVRNVAVEAYGSDTLAYITSYGNSDRKDEASKGYVSIWKLTGNKLIYQVSVEVGRYPEGVVAVNGKAYVAVSGWGLERSVAIVEMGVATPKNVEVMGNPDNMLLVGDRVFVQGYGDAYDYPWGELNTTTGEFTQLGSANAFAAYQNTIYTAYSETNWTTYETTTTLSSYDLTTGRTNTAFFKNVPEEIISSSVYSVSVNQYTGDIYIATTDFVSDGKIYKFAANGNYESTFSSNGVNPAKIVFVK